MVDPVSIASLGLQGVELYRAWRKRPEASMLIDLLDQEFSADTGLSHSTWQALFADSAFTEALSPYIEDGGAFDRSAFVAAIAPHVGALDPDGSPEGTAGAVADAIKRLMPRAKARDRDGVLHRLDGLEASLARPAPRLSLSWAPKFIIEGLVALDDKDDQTARRISSALQDADARTDTLRSLLGEAPPEWIADAHPEAWILLSRLAEAHGLSQAAESALVEAARRPIPRPASLLARAARLAIRRGDHERCEELLQQASETDGEDVGVLLARIEVRCRDPRERLKALGELVPRTPQDASDLACLSAEARVVLGDLEGALKDTARARKADRDRLRPRELEATAVLIWSAERIDTEALNAHLLEQAAATFLELASEMEAFARPDDAAWLRARSARCWLLVDDLPAAVKAAQAIDPEAVSRWRTDPALEVADLLLELGRAGDARAVLERTEGGDDRISLARAEVQLRDDGPDRGHSAIREMERLCEEDAPLRYQAALTRQLAALWSEGGIAPSDRAAEVFAEVQPAMSALLSSMFLESGEPEAAEAVLLPHHSDPRVLHRLADLAERAGDTERAIELLEAALDRSRAPRLRLRFALLLIRSGESTRAREALAPLLENECLPRGPRANAHALAVEIAATRHDWAAVNRLAHRWQEADPRDDTPVWERVGALHRLGEHEEALLVLDERSPEPGTENQAKLAAFVVFRAEDSVRAIERIAGISDRFDRRVEPIEALLLVASAAVRPEQLSPAIEQRLRDCVQEFPTRFPDSQTLVSIPAPTSREELEHLFGEDLAARAGEGHELLRQVTEGELILALAAAQMATDASALWGRILRGLPMGFANEALDELDYQDALAALGGAAAVDVSALVVIGGLGTGISKAAFDTLPGSWVCQSVLDDANSAAGELRLAAGQEERSSICWDARARELVRVVADPVEVERDDARAAGVLDLARQRRVSADRETDRPSSFDEVLTSMLDEDGRPKGTTAILTVAGTLALAERRALPVYSDDRGLRRAARQLGLSCFGTIALLEALVERGFLTRELRDAARRRLWNSGASGLVPEPSELVAMGRAASWTLDPGLAAALLDPAPWRSHPTRSLSRWIEFLEAAFEEAPGPLPDWTARVVDAAQTVLPNVTRWEVATSLLVVALRPREPASGPFLRALVAALRESARILGFPDPLPGALDKARSLWRSASPGSETALVGVALGQLNVADRLWLEQGLRMKWWWP